MGEQKAETALETFQRMYDEFKDTPEFVAYAIVSDIQDAICDSQAALDWTDDEIAARAGKTAKQYVKFLQTDETVRVVDLVRWCHAAGLQIEVTVREA